MATLFGKLPALVDGPSLKRKSLLSCSGQWVMMEEQPFPMGARLPFYLWEQRFPIKYFPIR